MRLVIRRAPADNCTEPEWRGRSSCCLPTGSGAGISRIFSQDTNDGPIPRRTYLIPNLLGQTMLLSDLLDLYIRKRLRGASHNTIRLYGHSIGSFARTLGHKPTIDDLTDEAVEEHMWRVVRSGLSPATANKDRGQLICLWKFAAQNGMVPTFPNVPPMKEPDRVPMGWLPKEVDAMLAAAKTEPMPIDTVPGSLWFTAMIRVLLDTGERVGAIRQLGRDSVQDRFLLVPAAVRKGKTRDRLYPLSVETLQALADLKRFSVGSLLFPWPYSETYLYNRFNRILERAGLPRDRRSKFHRIRRTVASAVARAGGDPTAALDHASPKTTKKYLDPRIVGGVKVSDILSQYLRDPKMRQDDAGEREAG